VYIHAKIVKVEQNFGKLL